MPNKPGRQAKYSRNQAILLELIKQQLQFSPLLYPG